MLQPCQAAANVGVRLDYVLLHTGDAALNLAQLTGSKAATTTTRRPHKAQLRHTASLVKSRACSQAVHWLRRRHTCMVLSHTSLWSFQYPTAAAMAVPATKADNLSKKGLRRLGAAETGTWALVAAAGGAADAGVAFATPLLASLAKLRRRTNDGADDTRRVAARKATDPNMTKQAGPRALRTRRRKGVRGA